ncbi:MAG: hypothetical protein P8P84_20170 [Paracoccaceae bacterium]|nr:hypothetical protein [Paracoccaceae bacterium]
MARVHKKECTVYASDIWMGRPEAKRIALVYSKLLADHVRWSVPFWEKRMVELGIVEAASGNMIHRMPKNALKMHKSHCWMTPPKANAAFVAAMEGAQEV